MTKKHEELVEEIYNIFEDGICDHCYPAGGSPELDKKVCGKIITLILSAVCDGLPLPGEKWRQQYGPKEVIIALWGTVKEEE